MRYQRADAIGLALLLLAKHSNFGPLVVSDFANAEFGTTRFLYSH